MELYTSVAYANSKQLTLSYSTSFGLSSRLLGGIVKPHIYAIYGLVRIADEIVDSYKGTHASQLLDDLETETYRSVESGYSTNPIVHAFATTARQYGIDKEIIAPFFASMRLDLAPHTYTAKLYTTYIYGSAEVVALMCLRVFCNGNSNQYNSLKEGAQALGSAYQKVNFLRDLAADHTDLGRLYFPGYTFEDLDETAKRTIIADITHDFERAQPAIAQLPASSRKAVSLSYAYYRELLAKLEATPIDDIKHQRVRVAGPLKTWLLTKTVLSRG